MRIKEGLFLHHLGDECIVMQDGSSNVDFSRIINLNPTAAWLWTEICQYDFNASGIAQLLEEHYNVSTEQARQDADAFIKMLQEADITE